MAFKIGDKVVCIATNWALWDGEHFSGNNHCGPQENEIMVISRLKYFQNKQWLQFDEFSADAYDPDNFRKLHDETVEAIIKQVTAKPVFIN